MRKSAVTLLATLVLFTQFTYFSTSTAEASEAATDTSAIIEGKLTNGRVLIPLRAFSENLGATVGWDNQDKRAYIRMEQMVVDLRLNSTEVRIDSKVAGNLDVPMTMYHNVNYVPISYVLNVLGGEITWDNQLKQAKATYNEKSVTVNTKA